MEIDWNECTGFPDDDDDELSPEEQDENTMTVAMHNLKLDNLYAAYQSILAAEDAAYHAWLDAGGHDEPGNEELFVALDALTEARVAKFEEWAKLAN